MKKYEFTEAQINRLKANLSKGEDNVDDELITLTSDDLEPIDGEEGLEESKVIKLKESDITKLVKAVLEEQKFMEKVGNFANKAGQAIKKTAGKVGEKLTNYSKSGEEPQQQTIPGKKPDGRDFEQTRAEFVKVNQDMSKKTGFGEAVGQNDNVSRTQAMMRAKAVILKKMNATEAVFSFRIIDEAMFQLPNGNKHYMVVIELDPNQQ
jgi:hypothetical protein